VRWGEGKGNGEKAMMMASMKEFQQYL